MCACAAQIVPLASVISLSLLFLIFSISLPCPGGVRYYLLVYREYGVRYPLSAPSELHFNIHYNRYHVSWDS